MQVTETLTEGLRREFKVIIGATDMDQRVGTRLGEVGRNARVPGFRPGKVPQNILKQRFGPSVVGEVLQSAVQESSAQLMQDRGLRPATKPEISVTSFDEGKDLEYDMKLEVLPEFEPMDFSTLSFERMIAEPTDDEVQSRLERLATERRRTKPVEDDRPASIGDLAEIRFVGTVDGAEFEKNRSESYLIELGGEGFLPGFAEQLEGHKVGEQLDIKVTLAEDFSVKDVAGKEAVFDCTLKALHEPENLPVDDDLAKMYGLENLDELSVRVREGLQLEYGRVARSRMKRTLLDKLADAHDFAVPVAMADQEFDQIWHQLEHAREHGQLDAEDADKSEEELRTEYRAIAERRVRLGLILSEVGRRNELAVSPEELNQAIMEEARRYPGETQRVIEYYRDNQQARGSLQAPIFEDKVVEYIIELAQVKDRQVSSQELIGVPEAAAVESDENNAPAEETEG